MPIIQILQCYRSVNWLQKVFSQDPLEAYFSRKQHKRGGCDNPGVQQSYYNTASLVQQREVYQDLKTMNVQKTSDIDLACDTPIPKRKDTNSCTTF